MPHEITQCYLPPGRGDIVVVVVIVVVVGAVLCRVDRVRWTLQAAVLAGVTCCSTLLVVVVVVLLLQLLLLLLAL